MHVFNFHLGGTIDLGWKILDSEEDVFGMFWANKARDSDGDKRDDLNKARVKASYQALSAIFNSGLSNGAPLPVSLADIASILGGTDIDAINTLQSTLGAYNSSGDYIPIEDADGYPIMSADPKAAWDAADVTIADCP